MERTKSSQMTDNQSKKQSRINQTSEEKGSRQMRDDQSKKQSRKKETSEERDSRQMRDNQFKNQSIRKETPGETKVCTKQGMLKTNTMENKLLKS